MTTLPKTGGTEWAGSEASPWARVNDMARRFDALSSRANIADRDLTAPPGTCSDGANYLIAATATGLWATHDGEMATAVGTNASNGWKFQTVAREGFKLYIQDEDIEILYDGAAWVTVGSPNEASAAEIWAGASTSKYVSPAKALAAGVPAALTSSANITPDGANALNFTLTLAEDATLENPSNFGVGRSGVIVITQDGTGGWTLGYGSHWKFPGGAPSLSTAPSAIDLIAYYKVSASVILATLTQAYSA